MSSKAKATRNRTISLSEEELESYRLRLHRVHGPVEFGNIQDAILNHDLFDVLDWLPDKFADVLFLDPPYNLTKSFNSTKFSELSISSYAEWMESWFPKLMRTLKPTASVYICGDWRSSSAIQLVAEKYLKVRNRITWEREKGRGAKKNWKNSSEDIWFCTVSDDYTFNVDAVKLTRKVIAPYTDVKGVPKDWNKSKEGNFRLTYPSNLWTDLTVPFWSMPENTEHPTQKPEKLLAKIILASSNPGDVIFDPFLGSGTTAVVAKKLSRRYISIEIEPTYCSLAMKRLEMAESDDSIQGYADGVFWERNSLHRQKMFRRDNEDEQMTMPLLQTGAGAREK